ncbi:MAG: hypothetical protein HFE47_05175 [Clostridia bacterium]|nr:hypothetical protein [Clostridia bacterium]
MYYLFLGISVVCFGFQFVFSKLFQTHTEKRVFAAILFNTGAGAVSCILFLILNRFRFERNTLTICLALGVAAMMTANNFAGIRAMSCGKVSVYTMFYTLGGMLLPFVYGIAFLNEKANVFRFIAVVLLIVAMILPCIGKSDVRSSKSFYVWCVLSFLFNGAANIGSKEHQVNAHAGSTYGFLTWTYFFMFALSGIVYLCCMLYAYLHKRSAKAHDVEPRNEVPLPISETAATDSVARARWLCVLFMAAYGLMNGVGNMLQLWSAQKLPAVLMYPAITGGLLILTAIFGRLFFKEKITKLIVASVSVAFVATLLFLF